MSESGVQGSYARGVDHLSSAERRQGIRCYLRHAVWNGFAVNLLNVHIISLLAIGYGATNLQLGYISSAFHVTGVVLVILPRLLRGLNIRSVFFVAWLLRGLASFGYASLFFLSGQPAVMAIMLVYTLFALFRSAGMPMHHPLQRQLLLPAEEGWFISRLHVRLSVSQLLSQVFTFIVTSLQTAVGAAGLVFMPLLGAGCNTVASWYISRIPSNEHVQYRRGRNVVVLFRETMRHRERSRVVLAYWLALASRIVFAFGIAFLRREADMPTNMVFLYTIAVALAAIAASRFSGPFADRMGSRPLLVICGGFLMLTGMAWALVSPDLPWIVYYALGFVGYFLLRLEVQLVSRLIVRALPEDDRIAYTSMLHFFAALAALTAGMTAGLLADLGLQARVYLDGAADVATDGGWAGVADLLLPHQYSFTFFLGVLLALAAVFVGHGLHDSGSMSIRTSASILLSRRNLRAFLQEE